MVKGVLGIIAMWGLGLPVYLPWILVRLGKYKSWYLAYFAPPFIWGRAIYAWPLSAFFICSPIIALFPVDDETFMSVLGTISVASIVATVIMIVWTPDWAKPEWQRYLENKYFWQEIRGVFIPCWRQMDRETWNRLMESEEGIEELVRRARESRAADRP